MYIDSDFSGMRVSPIKSLKNIDSPYLTVLSEFFDDQKEKVRIINLILLMYDPGSPFVKQYQNIRVRLEKVRDYTGTSDKNFDKILSYGNQEFLLAVEGFVKWVHVRLWSLIVVSETTFYEYQRELMIAVSGSDSKDKLAALEKKQKILEALDKIAMRLDGYYQKLFAGDTELEKKIEKTRMITPEAISLGEKFDVW